MTDRLTVGIDVSAVPGDPRGAGQYVVHLVGALAERGEIGMHLLARRGDGHRWRSLAPEATIGAVVPGHRPARLAWEQTRASAVVNRWPITVYHGPHYTMPTRLRAPRVVTVHDLTFFDHPEWHERRKVAFFRHAIRVAATRADALVCVSEATRRRLVELLNPQVPVHVVPHGVDHARFHPRHLPDDEASRASVGVPQHPYVLFLGTMEPRKNIVGLVAAYERVAAGRHDVHLVLAGGRGWRHDELDAAVDRSPHRDRIIRTGYVPDPTVPALLRGADVVVYPAFAEGFGMPVIEALACGVPVVTTAGSVMDELAGGAAITTGSGDTEALADGIERGLEDHDETSPRRGLGLEVAARFTWAATAAGHERVYASAVARRL